MVSVRWRHRGGLTVQVDAKASYRKRKGIQTTTDATVTGTMREVGGM